MASSKISGSQKRSLKPSHDPSELEQRCKDHIMTLRLSAEEDLSDDESSNGVDWLKEEAPCPPEVYRQVHRYLHENNLYQVGSPDDPLFVGLVELVKSYAGLPNTRNWEQKVPDKCRGLITASTRIWKRDGLLVTRYNVTRKTELFQYLWDCAIQAASMTWSINQTLPRSEIRSTADLAGERRKRSAGSMQHAESPVSSKRVRIAPENGGGDSVEVEGEIFYVTSPERDVVEENARDTTAVPPVAPSDGRHYPDGDIPSRTAMGLEPTVGTARAALSALGLAREDIQTTHEGVQVSQKKMSPNMGTGTHGDLASLNPAGNTGPGILPSNRHQAEDNSLNSSSIPRPKNPSVVEELDTSDAHFVKDHIAAFRSQISRPEGQKPSVADGLQSGRLQQSSDGPAQVEDSDITSEGRYLPARFDNSGQPTSSDRVANTPQAATCPPNSSQDGGNRQLHHARSLSQPFNMTEAIAKQASPPPTMRTDQYRDTEPTKFGLPQPGPPPSYTSGPTQNASVPPRTFNQNQGRPPPFLQNKWRSGPPPPPHDSSEDRGPPPPPSSLQNKWRSDPPPPPPPAGWPNGPPPPPRPNSNLSQGSPPPRPPVSSPSSSPSPPPHNSSRNRGPPPPPPPPPPPQSFSRNAWPNGPPPPPPRNSSQNQGQAPPPPAGWPNGPPPPPRPNLDLSQRSPPPRPPVSSPSSSPSPPPHNSSQNRGPPPPPPPISRNSWPNGPPPPPPPSWSSQNRGPLLPPPPPPPTQNGWPNGPPPPPRRITNPNHSPPPPTSHNALPNIPPPHSNPYPQHQALSPIHVPPRVGLEDDPSLSPPARSNQTQGPPSPPRQPLSSQIRTYSGTQPSSPITTQGDDFNGPQSVETIALWKKFDERVTVHVSAHAKTGSNVLLTHQFPARELFKLTVVELFQWITSLLSISLPPQLVFEFFDVHSRIERGLILPQGDHMFFKAMKVLAWEHFKGIASQDPEVRTVNILIRPIFPPASGSVSENMPQQSPQLHSENTTSNFGSDPPAYPPIPNQTGSSISPDSAGLQSTVQPRCPPPFGPPPQFQDSFRVSPAQNPTRSFGHHATSASGSMSTTTQPKDSSHIPNSNTYIVDAQIPSNPDPHRQQPQHQAQLPAPALTKPNAITSATAKIVIRIQIDGQGRLSRSYDKSNLNPRVNSERFFAWFAQESGRTSATKLRFEFKDALPAKSSVIAAGNDDHFDLMVRDIRRKFERAKEFVPDLSEFCIVITDPKWDSGDEDEDEDEDMDG